jgi:hypothetical protein
LNLVDRTKPGTASNTEPLKSYTLELFLFSMLATRASSRNVQRIARSFATVVDSAGVKVAAIDNNQPTSSITFLVKAGSRYEPKAGVAHGLKNFAFKVCMLSLSL